MAFSSKGNGELARVVMKGRYLNKDRPGFEQREGQGLRGYGKEVFV